MEPPQIVGIGEGSGGSRYYRVFFPKEGLEPERWLDFSDAELHRVLTATGEKRVAQRNAPLSEALRR